jgi:hypothetical protein
MTNCHQTDNTRTIPLLYAAADNAITHFSAEENDRMKLDYLLCPSPASSAPSIDVYGVNLFRFCSDQCTFHSCESVKVVEAFRSSPVPVLLTEYGCDQFVWHVNHTAKVGVNSFAETRMLLGKEMKGVFSGGSAYTFGTRGGDGFAFFDGGGRAARGKVGTNKRCGYPNDSCRVDEYEARLAEAVDREDKGETKDEEDEPVTDSEQVSSQCPVILGVDLTVADSRQGVDGYEAVPCQAGIGKLATDEDREMEREQDRVERQEEEVEMKKKKEKGEVVDEKGRGEGGGEDGGEDGGVKDEGGGKDTTGSDDQGGTVDSGKNEGDSGDEGGEVVTTSNAAHLLTLVLHNWLVGVVTSFTVIGLTGLHWLA